MVYNSKIFFRLRSHHRTSQQKCTNVVIRRTNSITERKNHENGNFCGLWAIFMYQSVAREFGKKEKTFVYDFYLIGTKINILLINKWTIFCK